MKSNSIEVSLRLRICDDNLHPAEIAKTIGLEAQISCIKGERRKTPKGNDLEGVYEESYCVFRLNRNDSEGLNEMLSRVSRELAPYQKLFALVREGGGGSELFIGWFVGEHVGEVLGHALLTTLGTLGIDLALDVYC